jgi:hypothetical protein
MSNVIRLPTARTRPAPDSTLRADCERLMRTLVREGRTPEPDMRALADFLDYVILNSERQA